MRGTLAIALIALLSVVYRPPETGVRSEQDGSVSVKFGNTYEKGELKIDSYDLTTMPALPAGYEALNKQAYLITTTAIVSGPHMIKFIVPFIKDEETFRRLRIFHAERDTFDPESPVWKDRTLLAAADQKPNFATRSINATTDDLGVFVIAKLVREIPPSAATADLSVTCEAVSERVTAPDTITYTVKVTNYGPNTASDIGLINSLAGSATFISSEPSQGKCKAGAGHFYCKLGSLKPGETATIIVKTKPDEGKSSFPPEGATTLNSAFAQAQESDPNNGNNRATGTALILPDSNLPPSITLTSPKEGERTTGPADITLEAEATDDRGIGRVEFYDNGRSIGAGASVDGKKFVLVLRGVAFGKHRFWAIATDTDGRRNDSMTALVYVNGPAKIQVEPIGRGLPVKPDTNLTLTARVTHPSGVIVKVEVFANDVKLGDASLVDDSTYRFVWKRVPRSGYSVVFVATDASGVSTTSNPLRITVDNSPPAKKEP